MAVTTILIFLSLFSIHLGQLVRLNFYQVSFPLFDIFISLFCLYQLFVNVKNKSVIKNKYFIIFSVISLITFLINIKLFSIKSLFYLIRLNLILSLFIFKQNKTFPKNIFKLIKIILFSNLIFGLIQYSIWPDLTAFSSLNWDPHLFRLVSTFLDPTFTGLIYLLFFEFLFLTQAKLFPLLINYFALALTYSRSSLLSLSTASLFYSQKSKQSKIFIVSVAIIISTLFLLPQKIGEGTKLNRTSTIKAKIKNYQQGFKLFNQAPLFGFGYNNLAKTRSIDPNSHAKNGFDSSLLTIATTTGIFGLLFFILAFRKLFFESKLIAQTMIVTVFTHSLFSNSLLYPPILFLIFIFSKYHK